MIASPGNCETEYLQALIITGDPQVNPGQGESVKIFYKS
jgi:hypothetical protein